MRPERPWLTQDNAHHRLLAVLRSLEPDRGWSAAIVTTEAALLHHLGQTIRDARPAMQSPDEPWQQVAFGTAVPGCTEPASLLVPGEGYGVRVAVELLVMPPKWSSTVRNKLEHRILKLSRIQASSPFLQGALLIVAPQTATPTLRRRLQRLVPDSPVALARGRRRSGAPVTVAAIWPPAGAPTTVQTADDWEASFRKQMWQWYQGEQELWRMVERARRGEVP